MGIINSSKTSIHRNDRRRNVFQLIFHQSNNKKKKKPSFYNDMTLKVGCTRQYTFAMCLFEFEMSVAGSVK